MFAIVKLVIVRNFADVERIVKDAVDSFGAELGSGMALAFF